MQYLNKTNLIFFFLINFLVCNSLFSQNKKLQLPQLWVCMSDLEADTYSYLENNGIKNVRLISTGMIDNNRSYSVNSEWATIYIKKIFPDPNQHGILVVDWEGEMLKRLESYKKGSANFKKYEAEYIKIVNLVKAMRPNVKVGIYGLPFRNYWNRNSEWKQNSKKLINILGHCDFIAPSIYMLYTDQEVSRSKNEDYIAENLKLALEIGAQINKPVMPFVWNRWNASSKKQPYRKISDDTFFYYLNYMSKISFNNSKIQGVIWWSNDITFYSRNEGNVKSEAKGFSDFKRITNNDVVNFLKNHY